MIVGYILIATRLSSEREVYKKLRLFEGVLEAHPIFGEYNIIAKIEAKNVYEMGSFVMNKIRSIDDVLDTKTLLTMNPGFVKETKKEPMLF